MGSTNWTYDKEWGFFSLRASYKEWIWCTNYPNFHIHTSRKRWSFILGFFTLWVTLSGIQKFLEQFKWWYFSFSFCFVVLGVSNTFGLVAGLGVPNTFGLGTGLGVRLGSGWSVSSGGYSGSCFGAFPGVDSCIC